MLQNRVAPLAGAWIETSVWPGISRMMQVAPLAGAWIETYRGIYYQFINAWSHPSRVRGLKHRLICASFARKNVAPLAGAWIETDADIDGVKIYEVAPLAGAWIETHKDKYDRILGYVVAPLAGAWIETGKVATPTEPYLSHPSRVRGLKHIPWVPKPRG